MSPRSLFSAWRQCREMSTKKSTPCAEKKPDRPPVAVADADPGFRQGGRSATTTTERTMGMVSMRSDHDGVVAEMLGRKRLLLVLDLDNTLLQTTNVRALSSQELYIFGGEGEPHGVGGEAKELPLLFNRRSTCGFLTKQRPFVHTFLREASTMYDFCICTNGSRAYAVDMARVLDPDGLYFSAYNIISRWDFTVRGKKGLDVVRRGDERITVILDDTVEAWEKKHRDNILPISPYHYFSCSRPMLGDSWQPPSELRVDEPSGVLATTLDILRQVHHGFFHGSSESDLLRRDVRPILQELITQKK